MKITTAFPSIELQNTSHVELLAKFKSTIERADIGFFRHTASPTVANAAKEIAKRFEHKKHLVHVGIGGSSLGPEMLISALGVAEGKSIQFLNNIDADALSRQIKHWKLPETFFFIVSKSGGTAETLAALAIISRWLKSQGINESQFKDHLVICTDPNKGELRQFATDKQIACLEVPPAVGGRFSVLTDVGLFPAAWAGVNVDKLVQGAESLKSTLLSENGENNILTSIALWINQHRKDGRNLTVLMPYSSLLKDFTAWWVQLWAESLGKEGKGLTPVMAYGATDQHSQMQLFMEGPADKVMLMLSVERGEQDFSLDASLNYSGLNALAPFNLSQLMEAEYSGTLSALKEAKRPFLDLKVGQVNAETVGQLVLFFESLTTAVGILIGIDPFNQPGVEAGKKFANEWLSRNRP